MRRHREEVGRTRAHSSHARAAGLADADIGGPSRLTTAVIRGAGVTGAGVLLTQVVTIASYAVLGRLAGPAVFGAFAAAWTLVGFSTIFVESGMSAALIQRNDRLDEAAATAVVSTFAAGLGLSALALVLSPVLGLYFGSREIGVIAAALSGLLFLHAASVVPNALLRRRFSVIRFGVIDPINALVYGVVAAVTLAAGWGIWGLVIAAYASALLRASTAWLLAGVATRPPRSVVRDVARAGPVCAIHRRERVLKPDQWHRQHPARRPVPRARTPRRIPVRVAHCDAGGNSHRLRCLSRLSGVRSNRRRTRPLPGVISARLSIDGSPRYPGGSCSHSARGADHGRLVG